MNNGERFMQFAEALDKAISLNLEILNKLAALIPSRKTENGCYPSSLVDGSWDNPRVGIPSSVIRSLAEVGYTLPNRAKKPITWIVCYVFGIYPDQSKRGWEYFQCSHVCTNGVCASNEHLVWEDASSNQSRGNQYCTKRCVHDNCTFQTVCACQSLHSPPCIKK
jgi:hypothetical protein